MSSYRKDEFATASHDVKSLKEAKNALYLRGFPAPETSAVVAQFYEKEKFAHLSSEKSADLVYLVAPSTSGENTLPRHFAEKLRNDFGGTIVVDWARPLALERAAKKGAIGKIKEPARYEPASPALNSLKPGATLVLVDDVVTTGQSLAGMREALSIHGLKVTHVTSLAQSELRKITVSDIDRLVSKLGEAHRNDINTVFSANPLKHYANYLERATPHPHDTSDYANKTRDLLRDHFTSESRRLREVERVDRRTTQRVKHGVGSPESLQSGSSTPTRIPIGIPAEAGSFRRSQDDTENKNTKNNMNTSPLPVEAPDANTDRLPGLTTGLDQQHVTHLLDRLRELRQEYASASTEESRLSVKTRADNTTKEFTGLLRSDQGSDEIKMRRTVSDFVEGKTDITVVAERVAGFQSAVASAALAERETQSQSIKAI